MKNIKRLGLVFSLTGAILATGCNKQNLEAKEVETTTAKVENNKDSKINKKTDNKENDNDKKKNKVDEKKDNEISGKELDKIMNDNNLKEDYLVIDTRSLLDYEANHVKRAINIETKSLEKRLDEIKDYKPKNVVVISDNEEEAKKASEILKSNDFSKVSVAESMKDYKYESLTKVKNVLGAKFQELVDTGEYNVVDARDAKDYEESHLQAAKNITIADLDSKLKFLSKDMDTLVYCYSGNKSFELAEKLSEKGFNVINSLDGTKEYKDFVYDK